MIIKYKKLSLESMIEQDKVNFEITLNNKVVNFPLNQISKDLKKYIETDIIECLYVLEELWLYEQLESNDTKYSMTFDTVLGLENSQKQLLGLPIKTVDELQVVPFSLITSTDFRVKDSYVINGKRVGKYFEQKGCYIETLDGLYQLTKDQYQLLKIIRDSKYYTNNIQKSILMSKVCMFEEKKSISLDQYFIDNEYLHPEEMLLDIEEGNEEINFRASFHNLPNDLNEKVFSDSSNFISVGEKLGRKRAVVDQEIREQINLANSIEKIEGDTIPEFIENPIQFIPENLSINLDDFSDRVRGLKTVIYRSNPSISAENKGNNWFDIQIEGVVETLDGETGDIVDYETYKNLIEKGIKNNKKYVKYEDGWIKIDQEDKEFFEQLENIENLSGSAEQMKYVFDIFSNIEKLEYSSELPAHKESNSYKDIIFYDEPEILNASLYGHQKLGYSWLRTNDERELGALLADDMGLGKTVQVIAYIASLIEQNRFKPTLLVLPSSLIENWIAEFQKFLKRKINVYIHKGSNRYKSSEEVSQFELIATTYETLSRDQVLLGKIDFSVIILDEAQKIKNVSTYTTNAVKAMKAKYKIALTGTPVENNLLELWSIVDFIVPGYLGSMQNFKKTFQKPIERDFDIDASNELIKKIEPVFMRRIKNQVLDDLPDKKYKYIDVEMSKVQQDIYSLILDEIKTDDKNKVLQHLTNLLMLSSHSYLVKKSYDHSLRNINDGSNKLAVTMNILKDIKKKKEKVLIFTKFKEMQRIIMDEVIRLYGVIPIIINGDVKNNRAGIVEHFNNSNGFNVMILSPKAAGVGLNIVGANHVIHYTREWNPAVENQATDRAYRIGQKKDVYVYYPIIVAKDGITVEQKLDELLTSKRELFESTIIPTEKLVVQKSELLEGLLND